MKREAFLENVAAAAKGSTLPTGDANGLGWSETETQTGGLVELFMERLEAVDGTVHLSSAEQAPELVLGLARSYKASSVLSWDEAELPSPGVLRHLLSNGLGWVDSQVPADSEGRLEHQQAYDSVQLGLTGADAGLAESGSVVLSSGPGRPRMASAIPAVHVALLAVSSIHPSLSHYLATHPRAAFDRTNLIVVTGPSRTGDIESKLTLGVHGPKHVHVVLIE